MSMVTLTSQLLSCDNNNNINKIRDASEFSDSRKKFKDTEIGIFSAEKYFNGGINGEKNQKPARNSPKKTSKEEEQKMEVKKAPKDIIVPSESSYGSQNALLQSFPPKPHQKRPKKKPVRSFLATIGCNCYCNDEKATDTDEHEQANPAIPKIRVSEDEKKVEQTAQEQTSQTRINEESNKNTDGVEDDKMRKSLEVFGSPILHKKKSLSLEKRLTKLKLDSNAMEEVEMCDGMYEDEGSDASSDLFEIASFTNNNPNSVLLRQASDGLVSGCVTPTACYVPSEASVEWSVVTASAAEFSVFSDSEEPISVPTISKAQKKVLNASKETERRLIGILSGCKSQKAVRVAEDAYRRKGEAVQDPRRFHMARSHGPIAK